MLEFLQTGKALSVLAAIGIIGIVSKLITRSLYKRLLKETDNMAMTKNKNLKVLKQKLENAYRLNQNIVNTQAYLDKHLYGFRFMHVSLDSWNNLSLQMTILSLLAGARFRQDNQGESLGCRSQDEVVVVSVSLNERTVRILLYFLQTCVEHLC
mgnify:CR=1 FL=1